jgi:hypothetical protein
METTYVPVHIALHGLPTSERLRHGIRRDFDRLKSDFPDLADCRVAVEMVNGSSVPRFCAHIELRLPQRQIIVSGEASESLPSALRRALDSARRQIAMPPHGPA